MIPYKVRQRMVLMELIVEQRPVGGRLDALATSPQYYGTLAGGVATLG